jgi:hypothetical protein
MAVLPLQGLAHYRSYKTPCCFLTSLSEFLKLLGAVGVDD